MAFLLLTIINKLFFSLWIQNDENVFDHDFVDDNEGLIDEESFNNLSFEEELNQIKKENHEYFDENMNIVFCGEQRANGCGYPGCDGKSNINGFSKTHRKITTCPYRDRDEKAKQSQEKYTEKDALVRYLYVLIQLAIYLKQIKDRLINIVKNILKYTYIFFKEAIKN